MCAISCAGLHLEAENDAKLEVALEIWICWKLLFLFFIIVRSARLTRVTQISC